MEPTELLLDLHNEIAKQKPWTAAQVRFIIAKWEALHDVKLTVEVK